MTSQLVDQPTGRPAGWSTSGLVDQPAGRPVGWSTSWRVDQLAGRINGRFAEADWVPVHYIYRAIASPDLAALYRRTAVCLVTPLRDGMNLVAKEFVAAQGENPGVLVLSKFCGAVETMGEALIVNPYDLDGVARAMYCALNMPLEERRRRSDALQVGVRTRTAYAWCDGFLADLASA